MTRKEQRVMGVKNPRIGVSALRIIWVMGWIHRTHRIIN